jgi:DNA polymerase delta subunit 1
MDQDGGEEMLQFQAISWHAEDTSEDIEDGCELSDLTFKQSMELNYVMQVFGRTADGRAVHAELCNFKPFFYISVPSTWSILDVQRLREELSDKKMWVGGHRMEFVMRKDLWGFSNHARFKFIKFSFNSHWAMRRLVYFLMKSRRFKCYESNVDPFLKFFHLSGVNPCGWIKASSRVGQLQVKSDATRIHVRADYQCFESSASPTNEDAPFRILSFDIECMSLNGEFPVAKRDYQKMAELLFDTYHAEWMSEESLSSEYALKTRIEYFISKALGVEGFVADRKQHDLKVGVIPTYVPNGSAQPLRIYESVCKVVDDVVSTLGRSVFKVCEKKKPPTTAPTEDGDECGEEGEEAKVQRETAVGNLARLLACTLPPLKGDPIIQIGSTMHRYGERSVSSRNVHVVGTCDPCSNGVVVDSCQTEEQLLTSWARFVRAQDPDIMTGFNIFGFDFEYVVSRAEELGCKHAVMQALSRRPNRSCTFAQKKLSSSALGDNLLKYIDMPGRVLIDMMKVVQRDHKLDSYKLDSVAEHFIGDKKHDVSPQQIFQLNRGSSADRCKIAEYCVQDCELVNKLVMKLEVLANNMGMANVCCVPLPFIFMRGQGIKIFSLVLNQCHKDGFVVPHVVVDNNLDKKKEDASVSYEGAIVLEPQQGLYLDEPVSVLDYASLYPSSMISENLSHDCIVMDMAKYGPDALPDVEFLKIEYDIFDDKKKFLEKKTCYYAQNVEGLLPRTLKLLLKERKRTRARMAEQTYRLTDGREFHVRFQEKLPGGRLRLKTDAEETIEVDSASVASIADRYSPFQKAVFDGLQNAYKVTANSLYGQMGSPTSQLYLKDIAACTTATGRTMIMKAKEFLEKQFDARIVYGDTDSIFCIFPRDRRLDDKAMIQYSIDKSREASLAYKKSGLKEPHDLEYDKTFYPFILLSKKRYVGNMYEGDPNRHALKSMGIVLKRRDNAPIVKKIYKGVLNILLNERDLKKSVRFLKEELQAIVEGRCPLEDLIISKSLRLNYKDPLRIAHKVLANRMGERDPGNRPQIGDRIPYVYYVNKALGNKGANNKVLQGDRIEHPQYVRENRLQPDYHFYITNQILKPVVQIYSLVVERLDGYNRAADYFALAQEKFDRDLLDVKKAHDKLLTLRETCATDILFAPLLSQLECRSNGNRPITDFFRPIREVL